VEGLLGEIIAIIDSPDTDLSTVIRKNVEKAELDSYLKGILFFIGKEIGPHFGNEINPGPARTAINARQALDTPIAVQRIKPFFGRVHGLPQTAPAANRNGGNPHRNREYWHSVDPTSCCGSTPKTAGQLPGPA